MNQLRCKCNKLLLTFKNNINLSIKCNRCKSYIDIIIENKQVIIDNNCKINNKEKESVF